MVQQRVTLRDVAAAAGVSAGTASYALNGNPLVRPATRERVLEAARRLDYVPDRNATRLRHGRNECIAVGYSSHPSGFANGTFYGLVVRGITEVLEDHGYTMRLVLLDDEAALGGKPSARRQLNRRDVDGPPRAELAGSGIDAAAARARRAAGRRRRLWRLFRSAVG